MITVQNLNFNYPGKHILRDVSFTLQEGSITALVGPNGAGKTTLLRCIAALEQVHSGKLTVDGIDVGDEPREVHRLCGYLSDFFGLYDQLTLRQCLTYAAWCHKIKASDIAKRIDSVAAQAGISDMLDKNAGILSRGYRQRLGIALSLIHDPKVLILDEPASGMDPESRIGLSATMKSLRALGKTIIVSSHFLNELEEYCTDMLVIRDGQVSSHVKLQDYAARALRTLRIGVSGDTGQHMAFIKSRPQVGDVRMEDGTIVCTYGGTLDDQHSLLKDMVTAQIPVFSFSHEAHTLQDAYMDLAKTAKD